ncbi:hypothetical protein L9F63_014098, partial [Diploptera punctata]
CLLKQREEEITPTKNTCLLNVTLQQNMYNERGMFEVPKKFRRFDVILNILFSNGCVIRGLRVAESK